MARVRRATLIRLIHRKEQTMNDIKVPPFTDGQKKVIEATERIANGKLICDVDDDIDALTNEEWFCSLDTEQKAEWLTNSGFLTCTLRDCEDCKYYDKNNDDCIDGYEATHDKQMWVEWLKQPHREE